jgi:hypothetical protein
VMSPCCGGCHILAGSRMQPWVAAKTWLVLGMPPTTGKVTVGVATVSVTGVN